MAADIEAVPIVSRRRRRRLDRQVGCMADPGEHRAHHAGDEQRLHLYPSLHRSSAPARLCWHPGHDNSVTASGAEGPSAAAARNVIKYRRLRRAGPQATSLQPWLHFAILATNGALAARACSGAAQPLSELAQPTHPRLFGRVAWLSAPTTLESAGRRLVPVTNQSGA